MWIEFKLISPFIYVLTAILMIHNDLQIKKKKKVIAIRKMQAINRLTPSFIALILSALSLLHGKR